MVDPFAALFGDVPKETKETKAAAVPNAPSAPSRVKISQAVQKAVPQESAGGKWKTDSNDFFGGGDIALTERISDAGGFSTTSAAWRCKRSSPQAG